MNKLFYSAFIYMVLGVAGGFFYRELTKGQGFSENDFTQLSVLHTHLLTLGFIILLIVLALEKVFRLSESKLFNWFFWIYNAGVVLTAGMMLWHGTLTVLGHESNAMISGIAGLGHIFLTTALIIFFFVMKNGIKRAQQAEAVRS